MNPIFIGLLALVVGAAVGWLAGLLKARADATKAGGLVDAARREAEEIKREARLAAPHPQLPDERLVIGLTVDLAMKGLQFVSVRGSLPAVEPVKRYARRGHDHLPR